MAQEGRDSRVTPGSVTVSTRVPMIVWGTTIVVVDPLSEMVEVANDVVGWKIVWSTVGPGTVAKSVVVNTVTGAVKVAMESIRKRNVVR